MRTRNDYRSEIKNLTDEQIIKQIKYHEKYLMNDELNNGSTTHLTKLAYLKHISAKRNIESDGLHTVINGKMVAK